MDTRIAVLESHIRGRDVAVFDDLAAGKFATVQTPFGVVLVAIANIAPYADGCRVVLRLGNCATSVLSGGEAVVGYTVSAGTAGAALRQAVATAMTRRTRYIEPAPRLFPGQWTMVELLIPGVPPDRLVGLDVRVAPTVVSFEY